MNSTNRPALPCGLNRGGDPEWLVPDGLLPIKTNTKYYKEYELPTPFIPSPGSQRIIRGFNGELYYTPDHYKSFIPLN